jgi:hypothetical protein
LTFGKFLIKNKKYRKNDGNKKKKNMAFAKIIFEHPVTGEIREAPVGFSWTTLFLGISVAVYREDWKWAVLMILIGIVSCGISWLVFPFIYNKLYIKELIRKGFKVKEIIGSEKNVVEKKLGFSLPVIDKKKNAELLNTLLQGLVKGGTKLAINAITGEF